MERFERLAGFGETDYAETRRKLTVERDQLHSLVKGKS